MSALSQCKNVRQPVGEKWHRIETLYRDGVRPGVIAERMGMWTSQVYKVLNKMPEYQRRVKKTQKEVGG